MIHCYRIVNSLFNSNTYILYSESNQDVFIIDCGDFYKVKEWLDYNKKQLIGIFVTHSHFDHVYGINDALDCYPNISIYLSQNGGKEIISSEKLNKSKYTDNPFSVHSDNIIEIGSDDKIKILDNCYLTVFDTPGHTSDSVSFVIENYIFTGDAFIPNIKTITKLKESNRELARVSIERIYNILNDKSMICPGHNDTCLMKGINIELMW